MPSSLPRRVLEILVGPKNRSQPILSPLDPALLTGSTEVRWRLIETTNSHFNVGVVKVEQS
jgi:hypothetical protein